MVNNVIFSAENIMDTMGISLSDDYVAEFEPDPSASDITSRFFINSKDNPYSRSIMACDIFENTNNPGFMSLLITTIQDDGSIILKLTMDSPYMKDLMILANQYIKFFKVIENRSKFHKHEFICLEIMTDYTHTDVLTLNRIEIVRLTLSSPYETAFDKRDIIITQTVDNYLAKIGFDSLENELIKKDEHVLFNQVCMQKTIDDMVTI